MDARSKAITNDRLAVKEKRGRTAYIVLGDRKTVKELEGGESEKAVKEQEKRGEREMRERRGKGC